MIVDHLKDSCDYSSKNHPKYVSCIVANKVIGPETKVPCVYWYNNSKFSELMDIRDLTNLTDKGKDAFGRQIIGRGFSIYVIGGQLGLGFGPFTKTIWRYCLLTRTWFAVSELPHPTRHMAVGFIRNKLYLVGGVGMHRAKLTSVMVLDIHTGKWSNVGAIPETFTEVPPSCVAHGKFAYFKTNLYIFDPAARKWQVIDSQNSGRCAALPSLISWLVKNDESYCCSSDNIYAGICKYGNRFTWLVKLPMDDEDDRAEDIHLHMSEYMQQIKNGRTLISFFARSGQVVIERGTLESVKYQFLGITNATVDDMDDSGFRQELGCFNIIDPDTLYQQISFDDQDSISV